jgi:integrative and conjugative element protein (TIGR02256 family)
LVEDARGEAGEPEGQRALPGLRQELSPPRAIVLPRAIHAKLLATRSEKLPLETGGFVIGRRRGGHFEVTDITLQGEKDRATPSSFERIDDRHRQEIMLAWEQTEDHQLSLIGDWHSHPVGGGDPSGTDRQAWRKLTEAGRADFIGIILGSPIVPRVFLIERKPPAPRVTEFPLFAEEPNDLVFSAVPLPK